MSLGEKVRLSEENVNDDRGWDTATVEAEDLRSYGMGINDELESFWEAWIERRNREGCSYAVVSEALKERDRVRDLENAVGAGRPPDDMSKEVPS